MRFLIPIALILFADTAFAGQIVNVTSPQNEIRCSFTIEVADTTKAIETGLMYRKILPEDAGMLFDMSVIPPQNPIAFWMKNTYIPLDILFIDEDNIIFDIKQNAKPQDTTLIWPIRRPRYVLEINGGKAQSCGIGIGDVVRK